MLHDEFSKIKVVEQRWVAELAHFDFEIRTLVSGIFGYCKESRQVEKGRITIRVATRAFNTSGGSVQ